MVGLPLNYEKSKEIYRRKYGMAYMENLESFRGTGELNAQGQSLKELCDAYDPKKYLSAGREAVR